MYDRVAGRIKGLEPGSASAWQELMKMLENTYNLYHNGPVTIEHTADINAPGPVSTLTLNQYSNSTTNDAYYNDNAYALYVNGNTNLLGNLTVSGTVNLCLIRPAKVGGAEITARSGDTAGSGSATLYTASSGSMSSSGESVTVYNVSATAIPANTYIMVAKSCDGTWWAIVESC